MMVGLQIRDTPCSIQPHQIRLLLLPPPRYSVWEVDGRLWGKSRANRCELELKKRFNGRKSWAKHINLPTVGLVNQL